ncbi:MAG TPA: helix-turn-helix transcriptional regulator [Bacteroidales bacterium]|nr:helix-turn-helix transcriptional regulator [Bacteroidales bacterium]
MKNDLEPENDVMSYLDGNSGYGQNLSCSIQPDALSKLGPFYYFCYDYAKKKYSFISDSVYTVLGYNPYNGADCNMLGLAESSYHPDFLNTQKAIYNHIEKYVKELSASQISKYIFRYHCWVQNKNKHYIKLNISLRFLKKKSNEILASMIGLCFKTGEGIPKDNIQTLTVYKSINNTEKKVFEKDFIVEYENGILTKKETQVWLMLKDNMSGKEIADELGLSIHTVNTHRKNIYKKLKN